MSGRLYCAVSSILRWLSVSLAAALATAALVAAIGARHLAVCAFCAAIAVAFGIAAVRCAVEA